MKPFISSGLQVLYSDRLEAVMVESFVAYVLVVSTRHWSKVSSKREKQSSRVWQDGGTLSPGCSVNH